MSRHPLQKYVAIGRDQSYTPVTGNPVDVGGGNPLMISIARMRTSEQQVLKNNKPVIAPF